MLNGTWKLLFTDAADATFRRGKRRSGRISPRRCRAGGSAKTFQEIDADLGWWPQVVKGIHGRFINCVDFSSEESKLKGFRPLSEAIWTVSSGSLWRVRPSATTRSS